ncbi:MAG: hypothetical protein KAV82_07610 [Phycisphaerae bacterium]|nr:hypothetical protein [Phycisphaerae bacterium]
MPDGDQRRPLLIFPEPSTSPPPRRGGGGGRLTRAAQQVPGLEWLAELDLDDVDPDFGFGDEASPDKKLPCRLYAVMSNQQAMQQLVSLWDAWCAAHVYELPLPPSLSGRPGLRRLVATLAWLTPVNPRHKDYRQAYLWYRLPEDILAVARASLDTDATSRGTVQHRILEGERATAFSDGDTMPITVSCKAYAGHLTEPVPYALAVTLEVADPIDIYTEVHDRIRPVIEIDASSS